ncbi:hypothetical protein C8F04DRAFT_1180747 [Mycena alexandri]|uniref:Uncharacterized protein n=1 Tax=Mycena alexandri TaxID=1745969 RepID=A0AAD6SZR2_9AGAR|nr:hypothetical protein C8F04DRAFT_1180747 [Mycena alexandri]
MSPTIEVSYTAEDVNVLKPKLIALVQRQVSKWPGGDFKPRDKKLTVAMLQEVLLNPSYGFTKQVTESSPPLSPPPDDSRDGSMQGSAHSPDPEFEEEWVELLIEDTRTSSKTIQPVCLWVCDNLGCKEGEWRADSKDLLLRLQTSISPLAVTTETPWNETKTYSGKLSHVPGRSGRLRKIKKSSMHKALRLSSSAFTQAENAVRILNIYGEGGSKPAQEVIAETEIRLEKPEGAKVLYPFLVEWEKDNS